MRFKFKCPKCRRKTLIERYEKATIVRKMLEINFIDNSYNSVAKASPSTHYRVYGEEDISDAKAHKWGCKCGFDLPVRTPAELIEWLHFHKMLEWPPYNADQWPFSRAAFIAKGEISRQLLEDLYGPTYVPPDEATLIAQLQANASAP